MYIIYSKETRPGETHPVEQLSHGAAFRQFLINHLSWDEQLSQQPLVTPGSFGEQTCNISKKWCIDTWNLNLGAKGVTAISYYHRPQPRSPGHAYKPCIHSHLGMRECFSFLTSAFYSRELNFHWNKKTILYHQRAPFPDGRNLCSHLMILWDVKSMSWKSTSFTETLFPACSIAQEDIDSFPKRLPQKTPPVGTGADLGSGACSAAPRPLWSLMGRRQEDSFAIVQSQGLHTRTGCVGHQAQAPRGSRKTGDVRPASSGQPRTQSPAETERPLISL